MLSELIKNGQRQVESLSNDLFPFLPENIKDGLSFAFNRAMKVVGLGQLELEIKRVHAGVDISYLQGGPQYGETILFLHGFSDSKFGFVPAAKELTDNYNLIVPDLPGFGESEKPDHLEFHLEQYTSWVLALMVRLGLKDIHLAGNSLGGAIAASVALARPDLIKTLTLTGSAGAMGDEPTGVYHDIQEGRNFFAIDNVGDFDHIMNTLFYRTPRLPQIVKHYMFKKFLTKRSWYDRLMNELSYGVISQEEGDIERDYLLNDRLKEISVPTLLIWGDSDRLFPLEIARIFEQNISGSMLVVFKKTGHMPQVERPGRFAEALKNFISAN